MYQSLITASVFILTLILGTLLNGTQTPKVWGKLSWIIMGALVCGTINFCIKNSRSKLLKFSLRVLNVTSAGLILGLMLSRSAGFCGNSTPEEIYWGRIWIVVFPTAIGLLAGVCGAVGGIIDDRRAERRLP